MGPGDFRRAPKVRYAVHRTTVQRLRALQALTQARSLRCDVEVDAGPVTGLADGPSGRGCRQCQVIA
jgi:hypothetical protein